MFVKTVICKAGRLRTLHHARTDLLRWMALAAIVVLAAVLRFSNLAALGYANHYYTAAVKSMLQSWHNFFFVAAEPGGSVSVDKPPVGLWLQTISAYFFGVNGFAVLLPQILAGIASVIVIYHLVKRWFGTVAGLLAALALAITPIVVATDRNNTIDSTLILTLLLAAWAFIKATESRKLGYLLLGATLVGIGFNIKMLQAYLPLPAFYALYLLGSAERFWRKAGKLAVASVLLVTVSLSWAMAVDLTPADQRPYVGSSSNNSVLSLIVGYNGTQRLLGMGNRGGLLSSILGSSQRDGFPANNPSGLADDGRQRDGTQGPSFNNGTVPQQGQVAPNGDSTAFQGNPDANGTFPQTGQRDDGPRGQMGGNRGGFPGTGQAGLLRLFTTPLSKEVSWLLPFGLFSVLLLALRTRLRWPLSTKHQASVLWGGWLLIGVAFFSVAGFFHEYYLSMLAPPLAALVGAGIVELWHLGQQRRWLAAALLLVTAGGTLALQIATARTYVGLAWYLPASIALFASGGILALASAAIPPLRRAALGAFGLVIGALLLTPGIWSGLTTLHTSANQSLPSAYSGGSTGPANGGGLQINQALLDYLQSRTQDTTYLMAVPSSMQGADYVLATGRPVLYMGGFSGQDQVLTTEQLAQLVAEGQLRYILWGGQSGGMRSQSDLSAWITSHGTRIQGFETQTRNSGAPDGTSAQTQSGTGGQVLGGGAAFRGGGNMQVALYELAV